MTNPIQGKTILLGVTGSIAAYKAAEVASALKKMGANVDVVLTPAAAKFVSPLTFSSVTGRKAYTEEDLWGGEGHVVHIGLGHAADLLVIAPVSATTLAKLAHGIGDNLLTVAALAASCPMLLAPAMDAGMFAHPATASNVEILRQRGVNFIGPNEGRLASGLMGLGRLAEPEEILGAVRFLLSRRGVMAGTKIVVTAGGTQEAIDPVRVITNRSSGKQGFAVARAALDAGADVTLISAPTALASPVGCTLVKVQSAAQMHDAVMQAIPGSYALVMAAAVADFRPAHAADHKIKKENGLPVIELEPTMDILKAVAAQKKASGFPKHTIGFAAESDDILENARLKLEKKDLDMIVANDILASDAGFESATNRVTLVVKDGHVEALPLMSKDEVAEQIVRKIEAWK